MSIDTFHDRDVVITILGGSVNGVFTDIPDAHVVIIDWDNINDSSSEADSIKVMRDVPCVMHQLPDETRRVYDQAVSLPLKHS